ncbi:ComF family protein [Gymnodinialimonas sp. 2305UL16-5]|uniref:ComF family protein n=1 Tax=Gymnodinialimonas mytili TaxID=3126503 RepID=UPI0030A89514
MGLQTVLQAVFPPECLQCGARVEDAFAICGACWAETPFILGSACDICGTGLPGQTSDRPGEVLICDECTQTPRPWDRGRAVMGYSNIGRSMVLAMKHGDRADIARAAGPWLARAAVDLIDDDPLLVPIPLHWSRLAKRRFNQAALLAQSFARHAGLDWDPMPLRRIRATPSQEGRDRDARYRNVTDAIAADPKRSVVLQGRRIILIDDVMTSGATFAAATEACYAAGAEKVSVLALARVGMDT